MTSKCIANPTGCSIQQVSDASLLKVFCDFLSTKDFLSIHLTCRHFNKLTKADNYLISKYWRFHAIKLFSSIDKPWSQRIMCIYSKCYNLTMIRIIPPTASVNKYHLNPNPNPPKTALIITITTMIVIIASQSYLSTNQSHYNLHAIIVVLILIQCQFCFWHAKQMQYRFYNTYTQAMVNV